MDKWIPYIHEDNKYIIPGSEKLEMYSMFMKSYFTDPEKVLSTIIDGYWLSGPKLIDHCFEELNKLSHPSMPENYLEDLRAELDERIAIKKEAKKAKMFKFNKITDYSISEFANKINSDDVAIDDIDKMTGLEFEYFLYELFSKNGYTAEITKASNDQGADLIISKNGEKIAVQAKRHSAAISNSAIQEVVAAKAHYNCRSAMVVTNSYFTKSAIMLAISNGVELCDREKLKEKLKEYNLNRH